MRAAIYARYSTEGQREASLEDQERSCRAEADRLGYAVVKVYTDAAISGQLGEAQRPGFQKMQEAARRCEFDCLIVDDASRLSRDQSDALRFLKRFEFWGVGLIARADGVNTLQNPKSSRLLFGVKSAFSEEFLRDLGEKTHRGLEGRARAGFSPGGLPYGYRSEPVLDDRGRVTGFRRVIHEPEAEIVRRIFRLYVGDEGGRPRSPRAIAMLLSAEGVAPPGARWRNRTTPQVKTWSFTSIVGHRRLRKGILNNCLYVGRLVWNRSRWLRDPDTKAYRYRIRPADEWTETPVPGLRIVPQDLWDRVHVRLALNDVPRANGRRNVGNFLLSGFVRCAECGGSYVKSNHSYRCTNHRNRGDLACTNRLGVTAARLERLVIQAIRERLYTPVNLRALITHVRDDLLARARHDCTEATAREKRLRAVEKEMESIKAAVRLGKATEPLLEMLEDAERRRKALQGGAPPQQGHVARLERILADLPARVQAYLEDLEELLAQRHVEEGKNILAGLGTEVLIRADGTAEIRGDLRKALLLTAPRKTGESVISWLGEEDSNPR